MPISSPVDSSRIRNEPVQARRRPAARAARVHPLGAHARACGPAGGCPAPRPPEAHRPARTGPVSSPVDRRDSRYPRAPAAPRAGRQRQPQLSCLRSGAEQEITGAHRLGRGRAQARWRPSLRGQQRGAMADLLQPVADVRHVVLGLDPRGAAAAAPGRAAGSPCGTGGCPGRRGGDAERDAPVSARPAGLTTRAARTSRDRSSLGALGPGPRSTQVKDSVPGRGRPRRAWPAAGPGTWRAPPGSAAAASPGRPDAPAPRPAAPAAWPTTSMSRPNAVSAARRVERSNRRAPK